MGRPKILSDEERLKKKKQKDANRIFVSLPESDKQNLTEFCSLNKKSVTEVIIKSINAYPPIKAFVLNRFKQG